MTICFRLSSIKYQASTGMGSSLHGGRWNPKGVAVVYAAASASLATLEILVQYSVLPRDFVLTEIHIPPGVVIQSMNERDLPPGWQAFPQAPITQELGHNWVSQGHSAVLTVPSAIVPTEQIYLLNPSHHAFEKIRFLPSTPFRFDPRLK